MRLSLSCCQTCLTTNLPLVMASKSPKTITHTSQNDRSAHSISLWPFHKNIFILLLQWLHVRPPRNLCIHKLDSKHGMSHVVTTSHMFRGRGRSLLKLNESKLVERPGLTWAKSPTKDLGWWTGTRTSLFEMDGMIQPFETGGGAENGGSED